MAHSQLTGVLRHLRRTALPHDRGMTDRQLLERFLATREAGAFEALLRRHGPMVLGICRRVLRSLHDAEDAFQATFIVLICKASSVAARESVGSWLYGVAYRTAQKARVSAARRRTKEQQMARPEALHETDDGWEALRPLLDAELGRLPDKYREPVILCDLQGLTRKEAARRLGCPEGTVSGRLSRAREMLAKRLARHGVALSGGAVALALAGNAASAGVPAPLMGSTIRAAALVAAGHAVAGALSGPAAALTEGVLQTMSLSKVKLTLAVVAAVGLLVAGWGAYQTRAAAPPQPEGTRTAPATGGPVVGAPVGNPGTIEPVKEGEKVNLPTGPAPEQVLASIDKDGKLVIKRALVQIRAVPVPPGGGPGPRPLPADPAAPPGGPVAPPVGPGGTAPAIGKVEKVTMIQTQTFDLSDVEVLDTKGKKVDAKDVAKQLKEEAVAMASLYGQPVDPLHLRVLKDGTLTFVLPAPKAVPVPLPGPNPPGFPGGPGGRPGGGGGGAPGGIGIAPPGTTTVPGIPTPPPTPAPEKP
jgi:RNA polymerase sigma factor (sigma-70 family)